MIDRILDTDGSTRRRFRPFLALVVTVVVLGSVATPVAADPSVSITDVSLPDSVTQGDSFDLTVSVSGDEVQNNEVDVSLTLPNGLSCSPSGSQTATLSGGTGSVTFDCTADVEGDYSGEISVSASATNTNNGNSLSATSQSGLEVLSPASLTLSTSIDSGTIDEDKSTTLTTVINNAGDASTSYSISLDSANGYSTAVDSGAASGTISGGGTKTITYTVTGDSSGSYSISTTASGGNGQQLSESNALTVESTGGGSNNGGSSSSSQQTATPTPTATATPAPTATDTSESGTTQTSTATPDSTTTPAPATETAADDPASPTPEPASNTESGADSSGETSVSTDGGSGPGFTMLAALLAISVAGLLIRRHR